MFDIVPKIAMRVDPNSHNATKSNKRNEVYGKK